MRSRLKRPSPSMIVALIALSVALGGTSYAAFSLPANSVSGKQIKPNSVGTADIHNNAINSAKVRNGSLSALDFKAGELPTGEQGPMGPRGPTGAAGVTNVRFRDAETATTLSTHTSAGSTASCATGEVATGGGVRLVTGAAADTQVVAQYPQDSQGSTGTHPDEWVATVYNRGTATVTFAARVVCAAP